MLRDMQIIYATGSAPKYRTQPLTEVEHLTPFTNQSECRWRSFQQRHLDDKAVSSCTQTQTKTTYALVEEIRATYKLYELAYQATTPGTKRHPRHAGFSRHKPSLSSLKQTSDYSASPLRKYNSHDNLKMLAASGPPECPHQTEHPHLEKPQRPPRRQ